MEGREATYELLVVGSQRLEGEWKDELDGVDASRFFRTTPHQSENAPISLPRAKNIVR